MVNQSSAPIYSTAGSSVQRPLALVLHLPITGAAHAAATTSTNTGMILMKAHDKLGFEPSLRICIQLFIKD